jgi:hypothetical protein
MSSSTRTPRLRNRCQDQHRPGYNIYTNQQIRLLARPQADRSDKRKLMLRRLPRLASLPGGNTPSSNRGAHSNRGGEYRLASVPLIAKFSWLLVRRPDLQVIGPIATSKTYPQTSCLPMHLLM